MDVTVLSAEDVAGVRPLRGSIPVMRAALGARRDAAELAILGAGVQARTHLEAIAAVRPLRRVRVWSRNPQHAADLVKASAGRFGVSIEAVPTAEAAVREADVVATVTA